LALRASVRHELHAAFRDGSQINLAVAPGVAVREAMLKTGEADYLSSIASGKAIATVEAKPVGWEFEPLRVQ
jgi:hypothetical protein